MRLLEHEERLPVFYGLFAGFALTTLFGPMMNNAGLYWIAIELTTLVSTFLVAYEHAAESIEAAWKYIIVVSGGISLALLGTVLFYWAGSLVLGPSYDMTWAALARGRAAHEPLAAHPCLPAGADRLWHEGWSGADAHLAAGRTQRRSHSGVRAAVWRIVEYGHDRHHPLSGSGGRGECGRAAALDAGLSRGRSRCWSPRSLSCARKASSA